jgi:hypothetical protein
MGTLFRIIRNENYIEEFCHFSMENVTVKEDELLKMMRLQNLLTYVELCMLLEYNYKDLLLKRICKLVEFFRVFYIDFLFIDFSFLFFSFFSFFFIFSFLTFYKMVQRSAAGS